MRFSLLALMGLLTIALASPLPWASPDQFDSILSNDTPGAGAYSSPRLVWHPKPKRAPVVDDANMVGA